MISMTMLHDYSRSYSSFGAQDIDEDTDDLEPMDPNIFFGADDDADLEEEEGDDLFEIDDDDDDSEIDEEEEEY